MNNTLKKKKKLNMSNRKLEFEKVTFIKSSNDFRGDCQHCRFQSQTWKLISLNLTYHQWMNVKVNTIRSEYIML